MSPVSSSLGLPLAIFHGVPILPWSLLELNSSLGLFSVSGTAVTNVYLSLYKAIVLPLLEYCCCVWDPPHNLNVNCLECIQSFAARIVTNAWSSDGADLRIDLGWPTLQSRRLAQKICLCYSIVQDRSIIPKSFFQAHPRPGRTHKNSTPLFQPFVWTYHHMDSFRYFVIKHWNQLPATFSTHHGHCMCLGQSAASPKHQSSTKNVKVAALFWLHSRNGWGILSVSGMGKCAYPMGEKDISLRAIA